MDKSGRRLLIMVKSIPRKFSFSNLPPEIFMENCGMRKLDLFFQVSSAGTFLGCFLAGTSFYFKVIHNICPSME